MKVLVTGTQGQLALSLKELQSTPIADMELTFAGRPEVDLLNAGDVARAIDEARPDMVINAAAYTDVDGAEEQRELAFRVNAFAAGEAAEAAARVGSAFIQLSTDYVFNGKSDRPWREDDPIAPLNSYGASKAKGEELVRNKNPNHLIIRTSWVVSPFGGNFVNTIIKAARARDALSVVEDQRGRPTSALDLASAIMVIIESWRGDPSGLGRTYHVAGSGETSWYGFACEIMDECRRLGVEVAQVVPIRSADWLTAAVRPTYSVLDCSRFEADFGASLPDWRPSLRRIVKRLVNRDG